MARAHREVGFAPLALLAALVVAGMLPLTAGLSVRLQPGEGSGRPMYEFSTVEIPDQTPGKKQCLSLRMDKQSHSLLVDSKPKDFSAVAWGCFTDKISTTGWSSLKISTSTSADVPSSVKIYAAGFLEGLLTRQRIDEFHTSTVTLLDKDLAAPGSRPATERVLRMALVAWEKFSGGNAAAPPADPVEMQAWVALLQLRGLRDGHNWAAFREDTPELSGYDFLLMNAHAETSAIAEIYGNSAQAKLNAAAASFLETGAHREHHRSAAGSSQKVPGNQTKWERWMMHKHRGTALVKRVGPAGDARDILAGHVTWTDYSEMTRIFKNYQLDIGAPVSGIAMSSYPGCISSTDDFFIGSNGMTVLSTNLGVPTEGPEAHVGKNNGLPSFLRAIVAMRLAMSPQQWAKIYGYITGIAGGKQWLIVDYNRLEPKTGLKNGTLFLVDALPRLVRATDVTESLITDGYFQAHGEPHFEDVRSHFKRFTGTSTLAQQASSALVEQAETIGSIADARSVLTNSVADDGQQPISARYDVESPQEKVPEGGIDAKVANACLVSKLAAQARSGPPPDAAGGYFTWQNSTTDFWPGWSHDGQPDAWNFDWVDIGSGDITSPTSPDFSECGTGAKSR